jgi:hypothetical protein
MATELIDHKRDACAISHHAARIFGCYSLL